MLIGVFGATATARAALYQFTLRGTITGGFLKPFNLSLGDECTIQYVLDSTDLDPHPLGGRYHGTHSVVNFPNLTLVSSPQVGGNLTVKASRPGLSDFAYYQSGPPAYGAQVSFAFPSGTLGSDALPLALPLSQATTSYFHLYPTFSPVLIGQITSYASTEVPEPGAPSAALLALIGMGARRFRRK
jgi:hypothetical protein